MSETSFGRQRSLAILIVGDQTASESPDLKAIAGILFPPDETPRPSWVSETSFPHNKMKYNTLTTYQCCKLDAIARLNATSYEPLVCFVAGVGFFSAAFDSLFWTLPIISFMWHILDIAFYTIGLDIPSNVKDRYQDSSSSHGIKSWKTKSLNINRVSRFWWSTVLYLTIFFVLFQNMTKWDQLTSGYGTGVALWTLPGAIIATESMGNDWSVTYPLTRIIAAEFSETPTFNMNSIRELHLEKSKVDNHSDDLTVKLSSDHHYLDSAWRRLVGLVAVTVNVPRILFRFAQPIDSASRNQRQSQLEEQQNENSLSRFQDFVGRSRTSKQPFNIWTPFYSTSISKSSNLIKSVLSNRCNLRYGEEHSIEESSEYHPSIFPTCRHRARLR